jgi:hypothetical protein
MLSEEQIKAVLAKYRNNVKIDTLEEAADVTKSIILELGRLANGLPESKESPAVDKATLDMVGKWESANPNLSFWESFYSRFKDDPAKAIEYLNRRRNEKSVRMKSVRNSPNRNQPKASRTEIESLLQIDMNQGSNAVWHKLRKSKNVDQEATSRHFGKMLVFNDGEEVPRGTFRKRVSDIKKTLRKKL